MIENNLIIQEAEENNLKKISVEIPLQKITTVIGVSGSGKSSLIYNVIAAESQRKEKIDRGLAECRDYAIRPKFTKIENLPYCVVVKQRGLRQSHSSTLATITGLHELLRDEFVKQGKIICQCGSEVLQPTSNDIVNFLTNNYPNQSVELFAVVADAKYTNCEKEVALLKGCELEEVIISSSYNEKEAVKKIKSLKTLNENYANTIKIRLGLFDNAIELKNALDTYKHIALENFQVVVNQHSYHFKYDYICSTCYRLYHPISSSLLSFNTTVPTKTSGFCSTCHGHGEIKTLDYEQLIISDKLLKEHFLNLEHNGKGYKYTALYDDSFEKFCKANKIDQQTTFFCLSDENKKSVMGYLEEKLLNKTQIQISKFIKIIHCPDCHGSRFNYKANAVKFYQKSISELLKKSVNELLIFLQDKNLHHKKILTILHSLEKASVSYLPLERSTDTFSGGELQRIKIANQLNANYKNLLYILDEPSIGLHAYDNAKFIGLIKTLKQQGNTVIISDHNLEYVKNSDYFIELGSGGGVNGGNVIDCGNIDTYQMPQQQICRNTKQVNLSNAICLENVCCNNIKNQNFEIPLNALVVISGVSGSGKSSLVHKVFSPLIKQYLTDGTINNQHVSNVKNLDQIKGIVEFDQSQIGVNSRSIVATYLGCFDKIRNIFANTEAAILLDLSPSSFSFNSEEGQCEYCLGLSEKENKVCPSCLGMRYTPQVLGVKYQNLSIMDILNLTIDEAKIIFQEHTDLLLYFSTLTNLGLNHLTLGRSTPTLSGGEGQRLKLAENLIKSKSKIKSGNFIYILDEPTTGLSYKDISKLFSVFDEILRQGNTVIIIEHNLDIIKNGDYIIDMGLGAGNLGGTNIFSGTYPQLLEHETSLTAKALQKNVNLTEQDFFVEENSLQEKLYSKRKHHENANCQSIYLSGQSFEIEKQLLANYSLFGDSDKYKFFNSKESLFEFVKNLEHIEKYAFNPFVTDLFIYKQIAITDIKIRLLKLSAIGFDQIYISNQIYSIKKDFKKIISFSPWQIRVITNDIEQAYNYGNGWLSLIGNELVEVSTRFVSIKHKIIGSPKITTSTFNRYLNPCKECYGSGSLIHIENNLFIQNGTASILDDDFLYKSISDNLKSVMRMEIKPAIKKLNEEGLFDFSKKFDLLTFEEKDIFFHGFIHKKFLKPKGDKNTKGDYISWKGLYFYIRDNLSKFEHPLKIAIANSIQNSNCPFCNGTGFNKELEFIFVNPNLAKNQTNISVLKFLTEYHSR